MRETKEREIKPIDQLVFSDDFMFGAVMRDPEICKGVLERLLQIKIECVEYPELQKSITPFYSKKGVRLDVYVAGSGKVFDVECQTYKIENIGKRTRYYQAMIDIDSLMKGADYSELKESYVIFICLDDPFGAGLPVYTFERNCKESADVSLEDQTHHVVFNAAAYNDETDPEIKDFLSFVKNNKAESDFTRRIETMVQAKKFEQSFVNEYMAWNLHDMDVRRQGIQQGLQQGLQQGIQQGAKSNAISNARNFLKMGLSPEQVSAGVGLPLAEVIELSQAVIKESRPN